MEEEEQLFSTPKEESTASEATIRVVQEQEQRMILQKGPLQKKIVEIMPMCKLKSTGSNVEWFLSIVCCSVLMILMKVDIEKPRQRTFITSDIRCQILAMNQKAKEDWDKKTSEEAEKLWKLNETEGSVGVDGQKDETHAKASKVEADKMGINATNVAARAAVGGDDMLSKWPLMSQNREVVRRLFGGAPAPVPLPKIVLRISVKDVIALLEREPQMSKSALLYGAYTRG
ncbi:hypothetical protein AMTRI_Chr09g32540 [Amborella trichopoda]